MCRPLPIKNMHRYFAVDVCMHARIFDASIMQTSMALQVNALQSCRLPVTLITLDCVVGCNGRMRYTSHVRVVETCEGFQLRGVQDGTMRNRVKSSFHSQSLYGKR